MTKKLKLLIVDDEPNTLTVLKAELEDEYDIETVSSGEKALQLLEPRPFYYHLMLLDEKMPNMQGLELARKVRNQYKHIRLVLISAHIDTKSLAEAFHRDYISGFVAKPWEPEILKQALTKAARDVFLPLGKDSEPIFTLIKKRSPDFKLPKGSQGLPCTIREICIQNFQCINRAQIKNIPRDANWVLLTGDNGDGKTSLLQAIAIGLWGNKDADHLIDKKNCRISIDYREPGLSVDTPINDFFFDGNQWRLTGKRPKALLAYGPSRFRIQGDTSLDEEREITNSPVYSLHRQEGNLRNIEQWMKNQILKAGGKKQAASYKKYKRARELLTKLMPNVSEIRREGDHFSYLEKSKAVPANHLSTGHKSILAMVGDMLVRLYELQPEIIDPAQLVGIVIIDELEAHLHPRWQREMPSMLSAVFPLVQFFASSHSILPFTGLSSDRAVFLLVTRDEEGTKVKRVHLDVENLLPQALLTSPLFGLENIVNKYNKDFSKTRTEDTYPEIVANRKIEDQLNTQAKQPNVFPDEFHTLDEERDKP